MRNHSRLEMESRLSQTRGSDGSLALAGMIPLLCSSPLTPSPSDSIFARREQETMRAVEGYASPACYLQPVEADDRIVRAARLHGLAFHPAPFIQSVSTECHLSRIVPAHPRSLARCFSRARRHSTFCFVRRGERPSGLGFQQQISRASVRAALAHTAGEISCQSLHRKTRLRPWERGTLRVASRRSVPSAIRGKSRQEKRSWHFMKTTSP